MVLEVYNQTTNEWDELDSDSTTIENTDFILTANIASLTDYKTDAKTISCRVYQLNV
jgi:hypothetical protein